MFSRITVTALALLALLWIALIFDVGSIVGHLGSLLTHLDRD